MEAIKLALLVVAGCFALAAAPIAGALGLIALLTTAF